MNEAASGHEPAVRRLPRLPRSRWRLLAALRDPVGYGGSAQGSRARSAEGQPDELALLSLRKTSSKAAVNLASRSWGVVDASTTGRATGRTQCCPAGLRGRHHQPRGRRQAEAGRRISLDNQARRADRGPAELYRRDAAAL